MSTNSLTITTDGILDQARAEGIAARIRAAVRHGKREIKVTFGPGTVLASQSFLAYLLRTAASVRQDRGRLTIDGDPDALAVLRDLGIEAAITVADQQGDAS